MQWTAMRAILQGQQVRRVETLFEVIASRQQAK